MARRYGGGCGRRGLPVAGDVIGASVTGTEPATGTDLRMRPLTRLAAVLVMSAAAVIWAGCGSNPSGPDDGASDDDTGTVLETASATIGSTGGTVALGTGIQVVVPAGALASNTKLELSRLDPADFFEGGDDMVRTVIACEGAAAGFNAPVELRVPLPAGMTAADSTDILAGLIDDATGALIVESFTIRDISGTPTLVLETDHFSNRLIEWLSGGPTPPENGDRLAVPYYNQGSSNYCWATSLQMAAAAASFNKNNEIPDIIGAMGVDESGITSIMFRLSPTIASLIRNRTGVTPDRNTWDYININQMKNYMKREIGLRGHPVALFNGTWSHAVVVLGYDGDTFYIHDPASTTNDAIGYTARTWTAIAGNMGVFDNMVTLVIPKDLDPERPAVTMNITPGAISIVKPPTATSGGSAVYNYAWDSTQATGWSFRRAGGGDATDPLPGDVTTLRRSGEVMVTNNSRTAAATVSIWVDIDAVGATAGAAHYSHNGQMTLGANSTATAPMPDIPVDEFRWNTNQPTEYSMIVRAMTGGTTADEQTLSFHIASVTPQITAITPTSGGIGTTVRIQGSGFGTLSKNSTITFNGIQAPLTNAIWADTEITIAVPTGATTGNVVLTRGTVPSNNRPFTVTQEETLTGQITRTVTYEGRNMEATATWTMTGAGLTHEINESEYANWFTAKPHTPARLTVTVDKTFDFTTSVYDYTLLGRSFHQITTYSNPRLIPMPSGADETEDPFDVVRISGSGFEHSFSGGTDTWTVDLTFDGDQSWQGMQLLIWCYFDENVKSYEVTEQGYVFTSENNHVMSFWVFDFHVGINNSL